VNHAPLLPLSLYRFPSNFPRTRVQVVARDTWFHIPGKFPLRDQICQKPLFLGYPFVISVRVTGNVLRRLHSFRPLVDIPQMCLSWVTFAEGCTIFQLSTSESVLITNGDTWMETQSRHVARGGTLLNRPIMNILKHHSPGGATIGYVRLGSPIMQWYHNPLHVF